MLSNDQDKSIKKLSICKFRCCGCVLDSSACFLYIKESEHLEYVSDILRTLEGRKEMFYLMTHSTHFIYGYILLDIMIGDH